MGRKSKLNEAIQTELYNSIAAGNTHETACRLAGIATSTFYDWMAKGEAAKSGKYKDFAELISKGEAIAEAKRIEMIRKASEGKGPFEGRADWKAAAWYLERRYPEKWGRRHLVADVSHKGEVKVEHKETLDLSNLSNEELEALEAISLKATTDD